MNHLRVARLIVLVAAASAHAQPCLTWRSRPVTGPTPRGESGFAFDLSRSRAVLVGGADSLSFGSVFREVWEYDGSAWSLRATDGPSARCDNAVAYDSARNVTVSFGGYNGSYLADTWEWNGAAWAQRPPAASPGARADSFMVFDQARAVTVLFGGQSPGGLV